MVLLRLRPADEVARLPDTHTHTHMHNIPTPIHIIIIIIIIIIVYPSLSSHPYIVSVRVCVCHAPLFFSFRTGFCVILFWTVMAADATPGIVNLGLDVHNENYRDAGTGKRAYIIIYYYFKL